MYYYRHVSDGVIRRAPSAERIARVERDVPGVTVHPVRAEGERLSAAQLGKDSSTFELAEVVVAGEDVTDMEDKYQRGIDALGFEIDDIED